MWWRTRTDGLIAPGIYSPYHGLLMWTPAVEARKLEHDRPPSPKLREEGTPVKIIPGLDSKCLEGARIWNPYKPMIYHLESRGP